MFKRYLGGYILVLVFLFLTRVYVKDESYTKCLQHYKSINKLCMIENRVNKTRFFDDAKHEKLILRGISKEALYLYENLKVIYDLDNPKMEFLLDSPQDHDFIGPKSCYIVDENTPPMLSHHCSHFVNNDVLYWASIGFLQCYLISLFARE